MCDTVIYIALTMSMKKSTLDSLGKQRFSWQEILKEISHFRPAINKEEHFCSSPGNHPITKSGPFNQMLSSQRRNRKPKEEL